MNHPQLPGKPVPGSELIKVGQKIGGPPYCFAVLLHAKFAQVKQEKYGSGTLITPSLVLTAGHCVVATVEGKKHQATSVTCYLLAEDLQHFQREIPGADIFVNPAYWDRKLISDDFALVRLEQPAPGDCKPVAFTVLQYEKVASLDITITGYDSEADSPAYYATGKLAHSIEEGNGVTYGISTIEGTSGAGLIAWVDGQFTLVGVHSGGLKTQPLNAGTFASKKLIEFIDEHVKVEE